MQPKRQILSTYQPQLNLEPQKQRTNRNPMCSIFDPPGESGRYQLWPKQSLAIVFCQVWPAPTSQVWPNQVWPTPCFSVKGRMGGQFEWEGPGSGPRMGRASQKHEAPKIGARTVGPRKEGGRTQKNDAPEGGAPQVGPRRVRGPKISLFFPSPASIFALFLSLGGPFVEFWWCLKRRGPEMYTFGVLGLSCEALAAPKHP